jgi:hemolysin D
MSKASSGTLVPVQRRFEAKDAALPAILEFQWPSTAIVNAPVPRSARGIIWMITSMVVILIVAAGLIPVDQVVTARGIVVSQSPTILVQPLDTAIVRSIEVREGQRVRAGEVLARLDPTFAAADLATLAAQVSGLDAEVSRLQSEAGGQPFTYSGQDPSCCCRLRSTNIGSPSSIPSSKITGTAATNWLPSSPAPSPMRRAIANG